jgi:nitrite reductase/ring-hydroxylating ferredoxin subunit
MSIDRATLGVAASLELATTYRRTIRAGIERIWENVFDWEHLPVLHETYFDAVELIESGSWGWRAALTKRPGTPDRRMVLELQTDRANARYRVQTLAGDGTGTEIWTLMEPTGPRRTEIEVRYYLPERRPERLAVLAEKYRCSCDRLWDEDEAMMMRRDILTTRAFTRSQRRDPPHPVLLGPLSELRSRLPLAVELDGEEFRVVELPNRTLLAHATTCPHWLGPLGAVGENAIVRCPWHRYLFDIRTGESADGRGYQLAPAPRVAVDPETDEVSLIPCARGS